MEQIKIVHIADLHLGSSFAGLSDENIKIRQKELVDAFDKTIDIVKKENARILLIAGDLFDNSNVTAISKYVNSKFAEIRDTFVLIAAGNHDTKSGVYDKIVWNDNVHIFGGEMEYVDVDGACIYGASFVNQTQNETLLKSIKGTDNITILVMHGDIENGLYNPMEMEKLKAFDYVALGHIHKFSGIHKNGLSSYAYSGFVEPRGFDEKGEGGIIVGNVGKGYVNLERIKLSKRQYIECEVDVSYCSENLDVVDKIQNMIYTDNIYMINLKGHINNFTLSIDYIKSCLENFCFDLQISCKEQIDYIKMANDYSLKGLFIKKMLLLLDNADQNEKTVYTRAIEIGLDAMEENEVNIFD